MARFIRRRMSVGLGPEPSRGTPVTPTIWIPYTEVSFRDRVEHESDESSLGIIEQQQDADIARQWSEGTIGGYVRHRSIGYLLKNVFGQVSTVNTAGETTVKDHTFTVENTNSHQSMTVALKDPNDDVRAANAMCGQLQLSFQAGQSATFSADLTAKKSSSASNTPVFADDYRFRTQDFSFKVAPTVAGLAGATAIPLKSLELTFQTGAEGDDALGTVDLVDIHNHSFVSSLSLTLAYNDTTFKNYVLNNTRMAIEVKLQRADVTLGTAANPALVTTFQPGFFSNWDKDGGLDDLVNQSADFTPLFSRSASSQVQVLLRNGEGSY